MKKHIFLDLDGTIFDFLYAEERSLIGMLEELCVPYDENTPSLYSEINDKHWKMLESRLISRDEVLTNRFSELFKMLGSDADPLMARHSYEKRLSSCCYYIEGAEALLDDLISHGYTLYLASNGTDSVQTKRIAKAGIEKYFREIFISERVGFDKPNVEYFNRCFAKIPGFSKSEAVIVGDSLSSDILGGINAGIDTIWYNPDGKPCGKIKPTYEIRELSALIPLLEKI